MDTKFYPQEEGINKFLNLIKKFGKISDSNKLESNLKNDENLLDESNKSYKLKSSYFIKTSSHNHPLEIIRRYINNWFCDICGARSDQNNPSYHCTLCDFDLCIKCARKYLKEGNIKNV